MKTAKIFWSSSAVLINIVIAIYIYLQQKGPATTLAAQFEYINENWSLYGGHWKAEFLLMTMMLIGAAYFMLQFKNISWTIITIGQFIILLTYPMMLGGYENTAFEAASMANQVAMVTFIFGNLVFFSGILSLYIRDKMFTTWLRYISIALSSIATLLFVLIFLGFLSWKDAMALAPIINVLYLINAYYGYKIPALTN